VALFEVLGFQNCEHESARTGVKTRNNKRKKRRPSSRRKNNKKRDGGDRDVVGPGKPRRRAFLLQLLAGRSPIGVEVRGPFRRARDAVEADCRGAGACRGNLAILRFVFHLFLSFSLSLSLSLSLSFAERQRRAFSSFVSGSLDLCCPRDLCARARERKKLRGNWLNFGSTEDKREERNGQKKYARARARFDIGSSPLAENFNRVSSFVLTTSTRDGSLLYALTFSGMRFFIL
jgi:hypothetical protein